MSSYSPSQHWQEKGQRFSEDTQFPRTYKDDYSYQDTVGFFDGGNEVMLNGGGPHVTNRDFHRQPSSPGNGPAHNWNQQYSHNGFREEASIPCGGRYDKRLEHGNNHSPQFSDSDLGRMDCHVPASMNNFPYSRGRRPVHRGAQGSYKHHFHKQQEMDHFHKQQKMDHFHKQQEMDRFHEQQKMDRFHEPQEMDHFHESQEMDYFHEPQEMDYFHEHQEIDQFHEQQQRREPDLNNDSSHGQQHFNSHQYQPRDHEHCQGEFQRRDEVFPPHGPLYPPPRVEDRIGSSPFQGPLGRTFDSYSSPTLTSSSWSPMCDSPESPILMPTLPSPGARCGSHGGGDSHPPPTVIDNMPHTPHLRPITAVHPQMLCHNSRVHEKALNPLQETNAPVVSPYRSRLNIRRWGNAIRSDLSHTHNSNNEVWNTPSEMEMSRDPRLMPKALAQKQYRQQVKQLKQDVDIMVNQILTEHAYCRGRTSKAEGDEGEVVCSNSRILTAPLPSSFLGATVEKKAVTRSLLQECSSNRPSVHASKHEASSSNLELKSDPKATSVDTNLETQFIDSTPKIGTVVSKPAANFDMSKLKGNSGSSSKLNYSLLSKPEDITKAVVKRTTKSVAVAEKSEKKLLDPLVFSLNLDSESSSSEEEVVISLPAAKSGNDELKQSEPQLSITNFDYSMNLIRLAKVDASRNNSSINGCCTANKLAIYASKSSPSACVRMENLTKSILQKRKKLEKELEVQGEWEDVKTPSPTFDDDDGDGDYTGGNSGNLISKEKSRVNLRKRRRIGVAKRPGMRSESAEWEFNSEAISARNRVDAVTVGKRKVMAREVERKRNAMLRDIEMHTSERLQTSRLQDEPESPIRITVSPDLSMDELSVISISSSPCISATSSPCISATSSPCISATSSPCISAISSPCISATNSPCISTTSSPRISATSSPCRDLDESSVKRLLDDFSPDVISRCKKISKARSSGDTPLHKVCRTGKYEMARYFMMVDSASVNSQDNAGWTPLHEACCSNHMKVAELLLKFEADANASATDGTRPIHDAIETGNLDLVKLLLQYGADPMAELGEKTPLEHALLKEQHEIHAYLESKIQVRLKTRSQKSSSSSPTAVTKRKPTRASRKGELLKMGDRQVSIPVDGYGPDGPFCGEELSYPLFYITPLIELSECPFLPVYNFTLVSGSNPRHHNFHLISEILNTLDVTEEELLHHCDRVVPVEFSVAEILQQMDLSSTCHKPPEGIMSLPCSKKLRFLPLCNRLRELLDIEVENLDE